MEKFAATGQKVHTIAERADKFLLGMWSRAVDQLADRVGAQLSLEVSEAALPNGTLGCTAAIMAVLGPPALRQCMLCLGGSAAARLV